MRRIFSTMMLVAAAAMAFVSCQKETAPSQVEEGYISFTSANPDTKTEWNGETIVWSVGDAIRVACQNDGVWYTSGSTPKAKLYASEPLSGGAESVQFKVKTGNSAFPADLTGSLRFYALYPSAAADASFDQDTSCESVEIEAEQKTSSSTYESSSDIMWGKATTTYASIPTSDPVSIVWNRVVAHANISLNKIPGLVEGEKINTITLTAQEDAALVGTFDLNMATGEFTAKNTSNTITLTSDIIADASGNISFWACINPCTLTELDITVDTDKAVYTTKKTGFSREFKVNQRNLLPINMSDGTRTEKEVAETNAYYVKVTEAPADGDWSGTYLLVCEEKSVALNGSKTSAADIKKPVDVTIVDGKIQQTEEMDKISVIISKHSKQTDGYFIKTASGYGVYSTKTPGFSVSTSESTLSKYSYSFVISDSQLTIGCLVIADSVTNYMRYNATSEIYSHYDANSKQTAVQLYKLQSN